MGVKLQPHNEEAYSKVKVMLEREGRTAVIHPTGTGKSFIAMKLIEENPDKKIMYLSSSTSMLHKFKRDMIANDVDFRNVTRCSYQKLTSRNRNNRFDFAPDIIVLDEFHHCGASEWGKAVQELLKNNEGAQILGFSATPIRYCDGYIRNMATELFSGRIASEMSLEEAIALGILKEPDYTTSIYETGEIIKIQEEKISRCHNTENKGLAETELKRLKSMLDMTVKGLPEFLASKMTNKSGKYIVYCKDLEDLQKKMEEAQILFGKVNPNMEILGMSSLCTIYENERTIKKFEQMDDKEKLKILFSVEMLNEGYHLSDLDGVIMMRPTNSPTLFYQQLGRALSVGTSKRPIVIDLVNNIDTIEIVEKVGKKLLEAKGEDEGIGKPVDSDRMLSAFSISKETRNIREIVSKIDSLVTIKRQRELNYEEKLDLMIEYMNVTGNKIVASTIYKGYNIGHIRNNLRQLYFSGKLNIDEELLERFFESGIIKSRKERARATMQEKYDFVVSLIGKSRKELRNAEMPNGMRYVDIVCQLQRDYKRGKLRLTEEQIIFLRENDILGYKDDEIERIVSRYDVPKRYALDIHKKYGGYEHFIKLYKKGETDYKFGKEVFQGYRGIIISEHDMTEAQKMIYAHLALKVALSVRSIHIRKEIWQKYIEGYVDLNTYIDIDEIMKVLDTLTEREQTIIKFRYGLIDGKYHNLTEIADKSNCTRERIRQIEMRALKKIAHMSLAVVRKKIGDSELSILDGMFGSVKELQRQPRTREVIEKIKRYDKAYRYYIESSNIFNPEAVIPGIPRSIMLDNPTEVNNEMQNIEVNNRKNQTDDTAEGLIR